LRWHLEIQIGAPESYGLKNIQPEEHSRNLIVYNSDDPNIFLVNSLLSSKSNIVSTPFVNGIRTLAFGLKVQYAFVL